MARWRSLFIWWSFLRETFFTCYGLPVLTYVESVLPYNGFGYALHWLPALEDSDHEDHSGQKARIVSAEKSKK